MCACTRSIRQPLGETPGGAGFGHDELEPLDFQEPQELLREAFDVILHARVSVSMSVSGSRVHAGDLGASVGRNRSAAGTTGSSDIFPDASARGGRPRVQL